MKGLHWKHVKNFVAYLEFLLVFSNEIFGFKSPHSPQSTELSTKKKKKVSIGNIYIIYKLKDSDEEKIKNETIERKMKEVK